MTQFEDVKYLSERWFSIRDLLNEKWKDIPKFEGYYKVSNYGRVKALRLRRMYKPIPGERILKNSYIKKKNGPNCIMLQLVVNGKRKNILLKGLVARMFLPNPNNWHYVKTKDNNPFNLRVDNLEWAKENKDVGE